MKSIPTIVALLFATPLVFANYSMPGPAPKVTCPKAVEAATSRLNELRASPDSYVDRMMLVGTDDQRVWVIWFASPTRGYSILSVDMDKRVRKATQKEIDAGSGASEK
jgi:hypothetical protein